MKKNAGNISTNLLIAIGVPLLTVVGSYFTNVITVNQKIADAKEQLSSADAALGERVSTVEANSENEDKWLSRIESKLDTVIANQKNAR